MRVGLSKEGAASAASVPAPRSGPATSKLQPFFRIFHQSLAPVANRPNTDYHQSVRVKSFGVGESCRHHRREPDMQVPAVEPICVVGALRFFYSSPTGHNSGRSGREERLLHAQIVPARPGPVWVAQFSTG